MNNTKRNKTGSFVEMWMDPETVIQSEISQKEKNQYHIVMHLCGIEKYGLMNLEQNYTSSSLR